MADVTSTLASWSSTSASNSPSGATTIGTGLAPNLREIQGVLVRGLSHKGADITSTATPDVGAVEGLMHDVTGTTSITGLGTVRAGIWKILKFEDALTLTHNGTSLILPGAANITTANGDVGIFMSEGSGNWRCLHYQPSLYPPKRPILQTEVATNSGTAVTLSTTIPSWAKKVTVQFVGVSVDGSSNLLLQLGISSGFVNSGYVSGITSASTGGTATSTAGFLLTTGTAAASLYYGQITLALQDASDNTWTQAGILNTGGAAYISSGAKALSGVMDRLQITTDGGAVSFDAGVISVLVE